MQFGLAGVPPRTEDMLDFIVVGGGIAGLATCMVVAGCWPSGNPARAKSP
ncbi:hypothetical protein JVU11DRAFT_8563 [Chiua virens]|nr:hypothetical protein JVU11DRAFT_8563 [Chiua virens]